MKVSRNRFQTQPQPSDDDAKGKLRKAEVGSGSKAETKKLVPANASVEKQLPIKILLDRDVKSGQKAEPKYEEKILALSQKMTEAADKYDDAVKIALESEGDERNKALIAAKRDLAGRINRTFSDVALSKLKNEIDDLLYDQENNSFTPESLSKKIEYARNLYDLVVFSGAITDPEKLSSIHSLLEIARDMSRKGTEPINMGSFKIDPYGEEIAVSIQKIYNINLEIASAIGREAYSNEKLTSMYGWLAALTSFTVLGGILFAILWWHYSSKGEDAAKQLNEWLSAK